MLGQGKRRALRIEQLESRELLARNTRVIVPDEVESRIAEFEAYFNEVMEVEHERLVNLSILSGTSGHHLYNLQLAMDGVLSMFEATGERAVLDMAIEYTDNVIGSAEVIEGGHNESDGMLDWEVLGSDNQPRARRQGFVLYDLQIGTALSRLARIIHEDPALQSDAELQHYGRELTNFVDEQIIFKWLDARNLRIHFETFYATNGYWSDKMTHVINICHNMNQITDDNGCVGTGRILATQFHDLLVVQDDGSYLWDVNANLPSGHQHSVPDTGHENRAATMITRLGADGFVFDETDIQHLGRTFTERIWNGRTDWESAPGIRDSPWFHNYIDGTDLPYRGIAHSTHGPEGMNGFVYDGWIKLGQFVPRAQIAGEALLDFVRSFSWSINAIRQRNGSYAGKIALPGHLARNLRFADHSVDSPSRLIADPRDLAEARNKKLAGDADGDGRIGYSDILVFSRGFSEDPPSIENADLDGDGRVSVQDYLILSRNFAKSKAR